jgi:hypothetical protein
MATTPLTRARPVLLALLAALAWLIWGAGTAQAATPAADTGALVQPASLPAAVQSVPLLPAPPEVRSDGNTAAATASTILGPAADTADAVAAAATPVTSGPSATVSGLAPALPELPLVQAPLPLPLPGILPLPEQLPALLPAPVPALLPAVVKLPTPVPGAVPIAAPSGPASSPAPDTGASVAGIPLAPSGGAASSTRIFGFTPAVDLAGSAALAGTGSGFSVPEGPQGTPGPLRTSAVPGHAGHASSGSFGGFGGAADIAGSWPAFPPAATAANRPEAETIPAGPSFDPGSTPD